MCVCVCVLNPVSSLSAIGVSSACTSTSHLLTATATRVKIHYSVIRIQPSVFSHRSDGEHTGNAQPSY